MQNETKASGNEESKVGNGKVREVDVEEQTSDAENDPEICCSLEELEALRQNLTAWSSQSGQ